MNTSLFESYFSKYCYFFVVNWVRVYLNARDAYTWYYACTNYPLQSQDSLFVKIFQQCFEVKKHKSDIFEPFQSCYEPQICRGWTYTRFTQHICLKKVLTLFCLCKLFLKIFRTGM